MGEFLSRAGVVWRVEILQEADEAFDKVGALIFEADEPLVIEWSHAEKEAVICGSSATLRIESPGDRTYEDLYTIAPGRIRMDVYRGGTLYWSGILDPEFYEEPYERAANYPVALTFSDFGVLDRLKYDLTGMITLRTIAEYALGRSAINSSIDESLISTSLLPGGGKMGLEDLSVRSDNFYDEDGEASTLKEVLEGVLQPLALRMVQRGGKVYIYDLNGLHESGVREEIYWTGDRQTMGTDKVVNNVKITFSPYAESFLLNGDADYPGDTDRNLVNLGNVSPAGKPEHYSYHPYYGEELETALGNDTDMVDFTIFLTPEPPRGISFGAGKDIKTFHIEPLMGSAERCDGVAWGFRTGAWSLKGSNRYRVVRHGERSTPTADAGGAMVMKTERMWLPKLSEADAKKYYLRLTLGLLLDTRYNPFEQEGDGNEKDNYNKLKINSSWAMVPVAVNLYDEEGNARAHYTNNWQGGSSGHLRYARGSWKSGEDTTGLARLEWYDPNDLKKGSGIQGWANNRHCIGRPDIAKRINNDDGETRHPGTGNTFVMFESFKQIPDGEYLPYPADGGWLEVRVMAGVDCYAWGEADTSGNPNLPNSYPGKWGPDSLESVVRWHLYKYPKLEIVDNTLMLEGVESDDIEYSAYINRDAKEELSFDTVCGTMDRVCPSARGLYLRSSDGLPVTELSRAGRTDHPENLLIGTLYSQFGDRRTKLEGECRISSGGLKAYTERMQDGKVFVLTGETQYVITDTAEATITELRPDEYDCLVES